MVLNRTPSDYIWAQQWNEALKRIKCSISGNLVCIKHFKETNYSKKKNGKIILTKFAVPSIFQQVVEKNNEIEDEDTRFNFGMETANHTVEVDELEPARLENGDSQLADQIESMESRYNKLKIEKTRNEGLLAQAIQSQSENIQHLTDELNSLQRLMESELIQFALNAHNPKVSILKLVT